MSLSQSPWNPFTVIHHHSPMDIQPPASPASSLPVDIRGHPWTHVPRLRGDHRHSLSWKSRHRLSGPDLTWSDFGLVEKPGNNFRTTTVHSFSFDLYLTLHELPNICPVMSSRYLQRNGTGESRCSRCCIGIQVSHLRQMPCRPWRPWCTRIQYAHASAACEYVAVLRFYQVHIYSYLHILDDDHVATWQRSNEDARRFIIRINV